MSLLTDQLDALLAVLVPFAVGPPASGVTGDVEALIRAIGRKERFVHMDIALLAGIDWQQIDDIGRHSGTGPSPVRLRIPLAEAALTIEHTGAVIDHVYLAFDGLTAALVNMTDTLGRLVNRAYDLGIDPRRSSLLAIGDQCLPTSSLGLVLNDVQYTDWLRKVRELRGRCQHADIEEVLTSRTQALSRRGEPYVDQAYSWRSPPRPTALLTYAREAARAADACLDASIAAILATPENPMQ